MIESSDFPAIYHVAEASSREAQRAFVGAMRYRLLCLVGAAFLGMFVWLLPGSTLDAAGFGAAILFFTALVVDLYGYRARPEKTWYEGRAVAESVKTLTWRYAVCAEPFRTGSAQADDAFLAQLKSLFDVIRGLDLSPATASTAQITPRMRELRASPLEVRKQAYETGRVHDQQEWYRTKALWNHDRAIRWTQALLLFEAFGVIGALLKATGAVRIDLLGFAAALVAAATAWIQAKQYGTLATAYSVTQLELASVRSQIAKQATEDEWSSFVADAEEAISREHTLWKASRGIRAA